jgi:HlyD family secretion protein
MNSPIPCTSARLHRYGFTFCLTAILLSVTIPVWADNGQQADVSALGRLQPEGGIILIGVASTPEAVSGSILAELHVEEGQHVEAGTLLGVTDSAAALEAHKSQASAEYQTAIRAAEASHAQADEACVLADVAQREAERRVHLREQDLASDEETEMALGKAEAATASCSASRALARVAEAEIMVKESRVQVAQSKLERAYIRAPVDGLILDIIARPGEFVGVQGLLELGRVDKMYAIAEVYETDIQRVRLGQNATIRSTALPRDLTGKVERIRPKVHKQDVTGTDPAAEKDARIIEVEILLDDPKPAETLTHLQVEVIIDA